MNLSIAFIFKKYVSILLMPLSLGIILAILALWFIHKQSYKKAKIFLILSVVWMSIISYGSFGNILLEPLEEHYPKISSIPKNIKYILLLGGEREERAWEALRLYLAIDNAKIITSGDSFYSRKSDAKKTKKLLIDAGVDAKDILMQEEAKDTIEEAKALKMRLGDKAFFLVTSAYHMPRAMMIFKKNGLRPIPAPTYFNHPDETGPTSLWKAKSLRNTERAWHEYLGLLWTKITTTFSK